MGCDIHGVWELKLDDLGHRWVGLVLPFPKDDDTKRWPAYELEEIDQGAWSGHTILINDMRNYTWFGLVAGVRGSSPPWDPVHHDRGVPEDACNWWKRHVEDWGSDMHSHTWLTRKEVARVSRLYRDDWESIPGPDTQIRGLLVGAQEILPWPGTLKKLLRGRDPDEVLRYVIGFDN